MGTPYCCCIPGKVRNGWVWAAYRLVQESGSGRKFAARKRLPQPKSSQRWIRQHDGRKQNMVLLQRNISACTRRFRGSARPTTKHVVRPYRTTKRRHSAMQDPCTSEEAPHQTSCAVSHHLWYTEQLRLPSFDVHVVFDDNKALYD